MISTRGGRQTAVFGKFLENLISGFESLFELAGFVESKEFLEERRLLGWQNSFRGRCKSLGHDERLGEEAEQ